MARGPRQRVNGDVPLTAVTIRGYRSARRLLLPVDACSVLVGANGIGKTNLYRVLGLLRSVAGRRYCFDKASDRSMTCNAKLTRILNLGLLNAHFRDRGHLSGCPGICL